MLTMKRLRIQNLLQLPHVAEDLMTPEPVSLNENLHVTEAAAFLASCGIRTAPVINAAGRPVGVFSESDIARNFRNTARANVLDIARGEERMKPRLKRYQAFAQQRTHSRSVGELTVGEIMTPHVHCVTGDTPLVDIAQELVAKRIHTMFVTDDEGVLIGVVTALDVLNSLHR